MPHTSFRSLHSHGRPCRLSRPSARLRRLGETRKAVASPVARVRYLRTVKVGLYAPAVGCGARSLEERFPKGDRTFASEVLSPFGKRSGGVKKPVQVAQAVLKCSTTELPRRQ